MGFGSGKNNAFLFNPNIGTFVITKEIADSGVTTEKIDRIIVHSMLTLDRKIPDLVSDVNENLKLALKKVNLEGVHFSELVSEKFLEEISQNVTH